MHERTNALAHALKADGVTAGDNVGLMCRNHRGFIDAVVACSKLGANVLFLNTAFSGPQLTDVAKREKPKALIYDYEFEELMHDASRRRKRYIAWHDAEDGSAGRPAARGPDRARRHRRRQPAGGARQGDHPHLRHHRARRRAPRARSRARSIRRPRCWR